MGMFSKVRETRLGEELADRMMKVKRSLPLEEIEEKAGLAARRGTELALRARRIAEENRTILIGAASAAVLAGVAYWLARKRSWV